MIRIMGNLFIPVLLVLMTACGGGGGGSSASVRGEEVSLVEEGGDLDLSLSNGTIAGRVVTAAGHPQSSVHLRAVSLADPDIQIGHFTDRNGRYEVSQLPEGDYRVIVENINGRGGVERTRISSTVLAPTPFFPDEYYDASTESDEDDPLAFSIVTVSAGQTTDGIDFVLNDTGVLGNGTEFALENVTPLEIPETITGVLGESNDMTDDWGLGYYVDVYTFAGEPGQFVDIDLSSFDFDTVLLVIIPSGEQLSDDDSGYFTDSFLTVVLDSEEAYIVLVTSFDPGQKGDYTLTLM